MIAMRLPLKPKLDSFLPLSASVPECFKIPDYCQCMSAELMNVIDNPEIIFESRIFSYENMIGIRPGRMKYFLSGKVNPADWVFLFAAKLSMLVSGFFPKHCSAADRKKNNRDAMQFWLSCPVFQIKGQFIELLKNALISPDSYDPVKLANKLARIPLEFNGGKITGLLGRGGTSWVYCWQKNDKTFALKMAMPATGNRLLKEYAILKKYPHKNLPRLIGYDFIAENYPALGIELLNTEAPISSEQYTDLHHALEHLHSYGILHGDLRSCNWGISEEGHGVLFDFGHSLLDKFDSSNSFKLEHEQLQKIIFTQGNNDGSNFFFSNVFRSG